MNSVASSVCVFLWNILGTRHRYSLKGIIIRIPIFSFSQFWDFSNGQISSLVKPKEIPFQPDSADCVQSWNGKRWRERLGRKSEVTDLIWDSYTCKRLYYVQDGTVNNQPWLSACSPNIWLPWAPSTWMTKECPLFESFTATPPQT